jgi:hypothetical protein
MIMAILYLFSTWKAIKAREKRAHVKNGKTGTVMTEANQTIIR